MIFKLNSFNFGQLILHLQSGVLNLKFNGGDKATWARRMSFT